ncbi:carcinoembryonic antigen-related cell adhesion molecule 6-like [Rhinolophus ferrumequinum]|uniref:carcinoembryonic antigen-related cell adhesion molecule 6-like n=1 Tax=Rhinolophus ferrumequinum TaxID=59479 RepID=UPI00140FCFDD|nr:carcinoembryonic antigen-related cell adhesion molecule 6-like [Rhinolophus ferrumequinum]
MEPPSAPARRGRVPWQGLLLAVSLLTFWSPLTTAQLALEFMPSNAAEWEDVLFLAHNLPEDLAGYAWFKGGRVDSKRQIASYKIDTGVNNPGPAYSGRETIYPNGSLLFQKVTLEDTGYYTLQAIKTNFHNEEVTGQLRVYPELPEPNVTSNTSDPVEHKGPVVFTCEPEIQDATYLWLINSQSVQNSTRLELSKDNRTLTLLNVTRNDTGPYECDIRNPVSASLSDPFYLNVLYGPEAPTISPSDTHYRSGANLNLSCHAASNPPAQYSWLINGRPKQSTQEVTIPNITPNDSGSYTCVVHNSVTRLNGTAVRTITVSDESSIPGKGRSGLSDGAIAGIVIGVLAGIALIAALVYFLCMIKSGGVSDQRDLTDHKPSASSHSPGHSDISPNKIDEVAYSSLNFSAQESNKPTSASPSSTATETV